MILLSVTVCRSAALALREHDVFLKEKGKRGKGVTGPGGRRGEGRWKDEREKERAWGNRI